MSTVDIPPDGSGNHGELVAAVLGPDVAAVVVEVITNPLIGLVDVPAIIDAAHQAGAAVRRGLDLHPADALPAVRARS